MRAALARAEHAARKAGIAALIAEVESESGALVVDACRHVVRDAETAVSLTRRPILFTLARTFGEAWPGDLSRDALVKRAFRAKQADESSCALTSRNWASSRRASRARERECDDHGGLH